MEWYKNYSLSKKNQIVILWGYFIGWILILPIFVGFILNVLGFYSSSVMLFITYFIGAVFFVYLSRSLLKNETSFNAKKAMSSILLGIVLLIMVNVVFQSIFNLFFEVATSKNQEAVLEIQANGPILSFLSVSILAPIVEEIVFRGVIFRKLRVSKSFLFAALISGFAFGSIHVMESLFVGNYVDLLYIFLYGGMGVVFAKTYEKTKSIYPCILLHGVYNALGFLLSSI